MQSGSDASKFIKWFPCEWEELTDITSQKVEDTCRFTFQRCSNFTIKSHMKAANCNFAFHGNSLNECHGSLFFGHFSRKTSRSLSSLVIK